MQKVISISIGLKKIKPVVIFFFLLSLLSLSSCEKDDNEDSQTLRGPEIIMGNGKANSFFKIDNNGTPIEIGAEMTMEALTGLPQDPLDFAKSTFVLLFNAKALELTPFDHLVINWNVQGHPPLNVFTVPHFDFHFYTITLAEQLAIAPYTPATATKMDLLPPAGYMPSTYSSDPGGIPAMGKHWGKTPYPTSFSHVMTYGSFNGQLNFVEPMVTLAAIQAGTSINISYDQPLLFEKTGKWYPTKYNIYKDNQTLKHVISLSEFIKR